MRNEANDFLPRLWASRRVGWLLEQVTFQALGWASYAVISKPQNLRGRPEFYYYVPEDRMDDWLARLARRLMKR